MSSWFLEWKTLIWFSWFGKRTTSCFLCENYGQFELRYALLFCCSWCFFFPLLLLYMYMYIYILIKSWHELSFRTLMKCALLDIIIPDPFEFGIIGMFPIWACLCVFLFLATLGTRTHTHNSHTHVPKKLLQLRDNLCGNLFDCLLVSMFYSCKEFGQIDHQHWKF